MEREDIVSPTDTVEPLVRLQDLPLGISCAAATAAAALGAIAAKLGAIAAELGAVVAELALGPGTVPANPAVYHVIKVV